MCGPSCVDLTWEVCYWDSYKRYSFGRWRWPTIQLSFFLDEKTSKQNRKAWEAKLLLWAETISVAEAWKSRPIIKYLDPRHVQTSPPSPSQRTPVQLCPALQVCKSHLASCCLHWFLSLTLWWLSFLGTILFLVTRHRLQQVLREPCLPGPLLSTCLQQPTLSRPPSSRLSSCPDSDLHLRLGPQLQSNNIDYWSLPDNKILEGSPLPHKRSTQLQKERAWLCRLEASLPVFGFCWSPHSSVISCWSLGSCVVFR